MRSDVRPAGAPSIPPISVRALRQIVCLALLIGAGGCDRARGRDGESLFESLSASRTGVTFANELPEDTTFNILNYLYYYNGGGVAAGDVNGDGLPDLYFTANRGSNRLYLNRGDYRFEDVTERAGVAGSGGWSSGVTMADVNGDGLLDIYVSGVNYLGVSGRNILYLNNGDTTFTDATARYGLEHVGYSTQALFFDYDRDGDLDMYLLNSSVHSERGPSSAPQRSPRHPRAGDRLFRNDGARFTDVSERAGIYGGVEGYGLGVVASDLDLDGCIDLYVANDFQENDFLYRNNCDGTFTESITRAMPHTSRFSMGADAADFNNDGWPDVVVLDMLPEREEVLKTSATAESAELFDLKLRTGYHPQFARNTLQLNRGGGRFSDIAYLAGVAATDWSWAPLFADLDNDGDKDLFVTNGIVRRPNDLDYIAHVSEPAVQATLARSGRISRGNLSLVRRMPSVPLPNYAFRNNGDLTFTNVAEGWGLAAPGFSTGAVYVDLNNSGALDLVVNNVNAPASIYRNRARQLSPANRYLKVRLLGTAPNTGGIGAKVLAFTGATTQLVEQMPTRGFQSAVDPVLHFGLGAHGALDSLVVIWPDARKQVLRSVAADTTITLEHSQATERHSYERVPSRPVFTDVTAGARVDARHRENAFVDYDREPLIPHLLSTEGPALAVADVNGDGLDDIYLGGARWQSGTLLIQRADGSFARADVAAISADSASEDVDAAFFDADGDGDQDLFVVSGGNELPGANPAMQDRLYTNDGRGRFTRKTDALPTFFQNGACVAPGDFDGDGDVDLFVGARSVVGSYGMTPTSRLLENDGTGRFRDATTTVAPGLGDVGMVTDATWVDLDGDGRLELVVVGEWMPVKVFARDAASPTPRLVDRTAAAGLDRTAGWWNSVTQGDLNGDGDPDLVLGNLGLNSYIKAARERPARLYVHDFGQNGIREAILTIHKNGVSYPLAGRDELVRAIAPLREKYPTYAAFGASRVEDIFPAAELRDARLLEATTLATAMAVNGGDGTFTVTALPTSAQFAPVFAALIEDFDGDGRRDVLLGGNFHGVPPLRGRYDASYGTLLRGSDPSSGPRLEALEPPASGVFLDGQVRRMAVVRRAGGRRDVVVAGNDAGLRFLRPQQQPSSTRPPTARNPQ